MRCARPPLPNLATAAFTFLIWQVNYLIGPGGAVIRALEEQSGARIQVQKDAEAGLSAPMRNVYLFGTADACDRAERLIRDKVRESQRDGGRGGGAPPPNGADARVPPRDQRRSIAVPHEAAAWIIGQRAENIARWQDDAKRRFDAYVRIDVDRDPIREPRGLARLVHAISSCAEALDFIEHDMRRVIDEVDPAWLRGEGGRESYGGSTGGGDGRDAHRHDGGRPPVMEEEVLQWLRQRNAARKEARPPPRKTRARRARSGRADRPHSRPVVRAAPLPARR